MESILSKFSLTNGFDLFPGLNLNLRGDDLVLGPGGDDTICVATGAEFSGHDTVYGGAGADQTYASNGDVVFLGAGSDTSATVSGLGLDVGAAGVYGGAGTDLEAVFVTGRAQGQVPQHVVLTATDDGWVMTANGVTVMVAHGVERIDLELSGVDPASLTNLVAEGGALDDTFGLPTCDATVHAGDGSDTVILDDPVGNYLLDGGAGADFLSIQALSLADASLFMDVRDGTSVITLGTVATFDVTNFESYSILGTDNGDVVWLNSGDDSYMPSAFLPSGNDFGDGGGGNDTIDGQTGDDTLAGGDGQDVLSGGTGLNFLTGGNGADTMAGSDGDVFVCLATRESGVAAGS